MPTYVCVVEPGLLNDEQKQRIASAITRLHGEATRAPTWLVQVVIRLNTLGRVGFTWLARPMKTSTM